MRSQRFDFGKIRIDGVDYDYDLVIDHGDIHKRRKKASKRYRDDFGHTPLSLAEEIPWNCRRLVVGTGAEGSLPVMEEVRAEAREREVELVIVPTARAIELLNQSGKRTNAIIHVTC